MADGERSSVLDGSTAELIRRLIEDANALIELQIRLAKQELKENLLQALGGAKTLAVAAGLGFLALIGLVVLLIAALDELGSLILRLIGLPDPNVWFWALVFVVITGAVAAFFGWRGIKRFDMSPMSLTRASLQEDLEWFQQPTRRNGR